MSLDARLPIGVIGVGSLGFHHARILSTMDGVECVGICDTDQERLAEVGAELGLTTFADPRGLLARTEAVIIAVPTTFHAEVALLAIEADNHILVEKPIAPTIEEADRILAAAAERGVQVATGHVERFNSALRACEEYLDGPRFIECHRLAAFGRRGTEVAVVLDLMIHDIDLILSLVDSPVRDLTAIGVPVLTDSVDIANARLQFEDGAAANITASRVSMERMRKIRIFQPSGYISLDLAAGHGEFLRVKEGFDTGAFAQAHSSLLDIIDRIPLVGDGGEPLRMELEAFRDTILGKREMVVTGQDGRRALAVALDIVRSTESHVADPSPA